MSVIAFALDDTLVPGFWFDDSQNVVQRRLTSVRKSKKSHGCAFVNSAGSHNNLELHKHLIFEIGSKESDMCSFIRVFMPFAILLVFFEIV